jgi:type VI secretion system protein ImpE
MDASQLFKAGNLAEAIDAQIAVVKAKPLDQGARLFLFELLAFSGEFDRAERQINAIQYDEPEIVLAVADYRQVVEAERLRRLVFGKKAQPELLAPPPEHVRLRLLGLMKLADGAADEAADQFQQANSQLPELKGMLNGKSFEGLRDGDDCLGSVLEVHSKGRYFWVPLEQVEAISMNAPRFPRDLLWIPAHLEMKAGDAGSVFLPALYPGTDQETDTQLKLGRLTDWRGEALVRGVGLKTFFVGPDESSILDWRKLEITT